MGWVRVRANGLPALGLAPSKLAESVDTPLVNFGGLLWNENNCCDIEGEGSFA